MIYIMQLYLIACELFSAGHDSTSIRLRQTIGDNMTIKRIKRWHRDGLALYILFCLPLFFYGSSLEQLVINWKMIVAAALIRVSIFDPFLNYWTDYSITFIGTTAWWDRRFSKIFGKNGALKKSITFFLILIILNFLNHFLL